jgi:hypothetical protein
VAWLWFVVQGVTWGAPRAVNQGGSVAVIRGGGHHQQPAARAATFGWCCSHAVTGPAVSPCNRSVWHLMTGSKLIYSIAAVMHVGLCM